MTKAATQKFIEVQSINDDVVVLSGGNACLVIEVQTANFSLLSKEEQDAKIFSYASLLNSLSFFVQILIKNKRIDISSYIKLLELEIQKQGADTKKKDYMKRYKDYIAELVKTTSVLDKKFYLVIPYSSLEAGVPFAKKDFVTTAQEALHTKANSLFAQLAKLNLKAKTLEKKELINLFYAVFNAGVEQGVQNENDITAPVVKSI